MYVCTYVICTSIIIFAVRVLAIVPRFESMRGDNKGSTVHIARDCVAVYVYKSKNIQLVGSTDREMDDYIP